MSAAIVAAPLAQLPKHWYFIQEREPVLVHGAGLAC